MRNMVVEFRDGYLVIRKNSEVCVKGFTKVVNVSTAIQDLDDYTSVKYIKTYINSLNLGFPLEFHTVVKPVDRVAFIKNLERAIVDNTIVYEVNQFRVDSKVRAERARFIRNRVLKDSLQPFEIEVFITASACSEEFVSALETLKTRLRILKSALNSLGVDIEKVNAEKASFKLLAVELQLRGQSAFSRLVDRFRRRLTVADLVSLPLFTFIPLLGRAKFALRSSGVRLGIDLESGEEVYWNIDESTSPHILVVGPSGIGKTTFLAELSTSISRIGIGVLVVDPKNEYRKFFESSGVEVSHYTLGRSISIGLTEILKTLGSSSSRDIAEVLLDILSTHRELGKKEVFSCLYSTLSSLNAISEGGDSEFINLLKRMTRYCSEEYSEYVTNKVLTTLATVSASEYSLAKLIRELNKISVVDISTALSIDPSILPLLLKVVSVAIRTSGITSLKKHKYWRMLVVDEAWTILRDNSLTAVEELVRVGRSFGTIVALATQAVRDFTKALGPLVDNLGLLVVLPSTSAEYWEEVNRMLKVSSERVEKARSLGRGYALVRIAPDPRATLIKLAL